MSKKEIFETIFKNCNFTKISRNHSVSYGDQISNVASQYLNNCEWLIINYDLFFCQTIINYPKTKCIWLLEDQIDHNIFNKKQSPDIDYIICGNDLPDEYNLIPFVLNKNHCFYNNDIERSFRALTILGKEYIKKQCKNLVALELKGF